MSLTVKDDEVLVIWNEMENTWTISSRNRTIRNRIMFIICYILPVPSNNSSAVVCKDMHPRQPTVASKDMYPREIGFL